MSTENNSADGEDTSEVIETTEESTEVEGDETPETSESDAPEVTAETAKEFKSEVKEAIAKGASEKEVQKMVKEFQLKVNGKNITKKVDLNNQDELQREFQLAAAGRGAMQELAELKRTYMKEIERLKQDPYSVLEELGLNPDEVAENRLKQRIEEMAKSPEQKEREQIQKELEAARKELQEQKKQREDSEYERLKERAEKEIEDSMLKALEAHSTLPATPRVIKQIADTMLWAIDQGWDDVTVEDILPTVEKELRSEISELMEELPEELMEQYIGQKNLERLRQKRINNIKTTSNVKNIKKTATTPNKTETKATKKVKLDDWMRQR